jgi:hypothetical protein
MGKDSFTKTLESMDASAEEIRQAVAVQFAEQQSSEKIPDIQPANFLIVELFFNVAKFFDRVGMEATPICLDPLKVETRAAKNRWYKQLDEQSMETLWHGLDVMENECLSAWYKQRQAASND